MPFWIFFDALQMKNDYTNAETVTLQILFSQIFRALYNSHITTTKLSGNLILNFTRVLLLMGVAECLTTEH